MIKKIIGFKQLDGSFAAVITSTEKELTNLKDGVLYEYVDNSWVEVDISGEQHNDTRYLTATELMVEFFGIDNLTVYPYGNDLRHYYAVAGDPYRNDYEQKQLDVTKKKLEELGVKNLPEQVKRDLKNMF